MKRFGVVVLADPGVDPVIPIVNSTEKVVAFNVTIAHQGRSMQAASVQYRDAVILANDHQVDFTCQCVGRLAVLQFAKRRDLQHFTHGFLSWLFPPAVCVLVAIK